MEPISQFYTSESLELHYLDWGSASSPLLVLLHGSGDHARSWDHVAAALCDAWHVVALDLRGHGDSEWSPDGAYLSSYHLADVLNLLDQFPDEKATILAHSFGGNVAARLAGAFPERVERLALIDGFGPPPESYADRATVGPAQRTREWIDNERKRRSRLANYLASIEEGVERLRTANPALTPDLALHLARHGLAKADRGFYWKHAPQAGNFAPEEFAADNALEVWPAITCPTLLCYGANSWNKAACSDGRTDKIPHARIVEIADAGHWPHHEQRAEFLRIIGDFLS